MRFPLAVRLPEQLRTDPAALSDITLATPLGERIPLTRLAAIQEIQGPKAISREWGKRRLTIQCNVRGRDVGSFVAEAQARIAQAVRLPESGGYRLEWGGQFENMQRAQRRLSIVVPIALALIVGLLYLTYRNLLDSARVFASVPFACVGGIVALWFRGMPLSISAAVGFITLSGVSVLSSMILLSFYRNERQRHRSQESTDEARSTAVQAASITALRTVLMTALVASVGFVPMAFNSGTGAEVQRPLATVVIGGVLSSTLFTLCVLPVLLAARAPWSRRASA
jgi:cobalt-zinc-cadmium resistance protein CzcA